MTALLIAVAGGAGGFLGSTVSAWVGHRTQDHAARRAQQQRDADALGPVLSYLVDTDPTRLANNVTPDQEERERVFRELKDRRDKLRVQLLVVAAGHPDEEVRLMCRELSARLYNALTSASWAIHDQYEPGYGENLTENAQAEHQLAYDLAEQLLEAIANYGSGK